jgi:hypothetical protein
MSKHKNPASKEIKKENIIYLFHHIHHESGRHQIHHCGGKHEGVDYEIRHCSCGLHRIDKQVATGDTIDEKLTEKKVLIKFKEKCPDGGWHLESGQLVG